MTIRITQSQLESYLWGAAVLLRGTIDAGDYKQFIFPLLFYKRLCDVFDEETQAALTESGGDTEYASFPENHRFIIPPEAHWREVRKVATDVGRALQNAMRAIETVNPDKLYGIFGDTQWTNKDRLSDTMLRDLVEHFGALELTITNLPEDELGQGYEYLIKKFADDAGHTAAEFYTNRTVVHLMTELLQPQPGESIYDPTCGSGGMLLSCIAQLRRQGKEWRNVRLYGQERNLMTSSIARMNCFLHGLEDFRIERGDTLSEPKFVQGDRLMQFDIVLANPPYSIKQWDRNAFASDPWGRNLYGTPPQGRADYAFWQHILQSLTPDKGRCAILFPHGVLFRQEEAEMRRKLIEADLIECVLGLGPNLFYNSPMEACVVICRSAKPRLRRNKILFINAVNEVTRERSQSYLTDDHIAHIVQAYEQFANESGFASVAPIDEIRTKDYNLSIPLYVTPSDMTEVDRLNSNTTLAVALDRWLVSRKSVAESLRAIFPNMILPALDKTLNGFESNALFDRSDWQTLPFGEFAQSVNERVEPSEAADEIYVGLEHIDPQDLHIRRWGKGSDVIGTKMRFRKGDIIFGRRRAYQRKLALAEVEGICSAHALVVRAKPRLILPEYLPFFMMSNLFMNRAVDISVGSLSPTINWTTLKLEKFALPPLDQQRSIEEMLWAVDEYQQATELVSAGIDECIKAELSAVFLKQDDNIPLLRIEEVAAKQKHAIVDGPFGSNLKSIHYRTSGIPVIQSNFVTSGRFKADNYVYVTPEHFESEKRSRTEPGDIIVAKIGENCGTCAILPEKHPVSIIAGNVLKVTTDPEVCLNRFLLYFLKFEYARNKLINIKNTTAQPAISMAQLKRLKFRVPSINKQEKLLDRISDFEEVRAKVEHTIVSISLLRTSLIDRLIE